MSHFINSFTMLHHPLAATGDEDNRTGCILQVIRAPSYRLVIALVVALSAWLSVFAPGFAQEPGTVSVTVSPVDGKHRGIVLRAQTVDVTIEEREGTVWADTQIWMWLQNPATKAITVPVTLPGPRVFPGDLPADLSVTLNSVPLELNTSATPEESGGASARAALPIGAGKSAYLELAYRQSLPQVDGMAVFTYLSTTAKQWARAPEGVRVTVRLADPITKDQVLSVAPQPHSRVGGTLSWHWQGEAKLLNVGLALMAPVWWEGFQKERERLASGVARAEDYIAVSDRYMHLARLPALPFDGSSFFDRYFPSATAVLSSGVERNFDQEDGKAALHTRLAALYEERAGRAEGARATNYTQVAAEHVREALQTAEPDEQTLQLAQRVLGQALKDAQSEQDRASAAAYGEQLLALKTPGRVPSADAAQRQDALDAAVQAVQRGDLPQARTLAASILGAEGVQLASAPAPLIGASEVIVETADGGRQITFTLEDERTPDSTSKLLSEVVAAAKATGIQTIREGQSVSILLEPNDTAHLDTHQNALAKRLPDRPELALLRDVLRPRQLSLEYALTPLQEAQYYTETIDLNSSTERWTALAATLEAASQEEERLAATEPAGSGAQDSVALAGLRAAFLRSDAEAWRQFADSSRAIYRVELANGAVQREWMARPGAKRLLVARAASWRAERLPFLLAGAGAALAVPAVMLAVLAVLRTRPPRRRATSSRAAGSD